MLKIVVLLMTISGVFSAELPRDAQRELDAFDKGVAKIDAERQDKLDALIDKAVKALNVAAKNAEDVEERRAIDDKILELKKQRSQLDLLGDKATPWSGFVGTWLVAIASDRSRWVVKSDGTIEATDFTHRTTWAGKLEYRKERNDLFVSSADGKNWVTVRLPVGKTAATGDNSFYGENSVTFTKEGSKP